MSSLKLRQRLTDEVVRDIKMMLLYSGLTQIEIVRYHNTAQSTVSEIKSGDLYRNVDIH